VLAEIDETNRVNFIRFIDIPVPIVIYLVVGRFIDQAVIIVVDTVCRVSWSSQVRDTDKTGGTCEIILTEIAVPGISHVNVYSVSFRRYTITNETDKVVTECHTDVHIAVVTDPGVPHHDISPVAHIEIEYNRLARQSSPERQTALADLYGYLELAEDRNPVHRCVCRHKILVADNVRDKLPGFWMLDSKPIRPLIKVVWVGAVEDPSQGVIGILVICALSEFRVSPQRIIALYKDLIHISVSVPIILCTQPETGTKDIIVRGVGWKEACTMTKYHIISNNSNIGDHQINRTDIMSLQIEPG